MAKSKLNDPGWDHLFEKAGEEYNIDPRLLKALMFQETGPDTKPEDRIMRVSPKGAAGPMQLIPSSFPDIDPYDPAQAIPAAAKYLAEGMDKHNDPVAALKYYHGGPDQKQWGTLTNAYPRGVANYYQQLGGGPQSGYPFEVTKTNAAFPTLPENTTNYPGESDPSHGYPAPRPYPTIAEAKRAYPNQEIHKAPGGGFIGEEAFPYPFVDGTSVERKTTFTDARSADQIPPPRGDVAGAVPFMERANAEAKVKMAGFLDAVNERFGQQSPTKGGPVADLPPGQMQTSLPPSYEKEVEGAVGDWNTARAQAKGYGNRMFNLDQAIRSQEELEKSGGKTGPGTDVENHIRSFLQAHSPEVLKRAGLTPDEIRTADWEKLNKYLTRMTQDTANSMGPFTNQGLTTTMSGSPNITLSNMGLRELLKSQKALERMNQAATLDFLDSGKPGAEYPDYIIKFSTRADPRAFMMDMIDPDKLQAIQKSLTNPAQQEDFRRQVEMAERYKLMFPAGQ